MFYIPEVIFKVKALKFYTLGPLTGFLDIIDGFNRILIFVFLTNFRDFALMNMRACNDGLSAH